MGHDGSKAYSRAVSFSERSFFSGPGITRQSLSVEYVFEGQGPITLDELRAGVHKAAEANPGSRLRLRGCLWRLRWEASGAPPAVSSLSSRDSDAFTQAFDLKRGPTCEVVLIQGTKTQIIFRAFHGVMDGRGLLNFAEDVFRALRHEACKGHLNTITDSELIKDLAPESFRPMRPQKYSPPVAKLSSNSNERRILSQRVRCDGHVPSLPAKIAAALSAGSSQENISFMTPVDIRFYKPGIRSTGNLSSPIYFDCKKGESSESVQESIMKALLEKEALRREPSETFFACFPLGFIKLMILAFEWMQRKRRRYIFSTYISHLNLPKKALFSSEQFRCESAFVSPPQTEFFPLGISAITLEGSTQITIFGPRYIVDENAIRDIAQRLEAALVSGCK